MKRTPARRSSLFLLECIIAISFFILSALVCVCIFAKSYSIGKDSEDLTMAVHLSSSYVEEFRSGKTFAPETRVFYDEAWAECEEANAAHILTITTHTEDDMILGHFAMDDIFETSFEKYIGGGK